MAEADDIIGLDIDARNAIKALTAIDKAFRAAAQGPLIFGKAAGRLTTDMVNNIEAFETFREVVTETGQTIRASFSGKAGDVEKVTISVKEATERSKNLKKELEATLKSASQLAKQNLVDKGIGKKLSDTVPFRDTLIPRNLPSQLNTEGQTKLINSYKQVLLAQKQAKLGQLELSEVLQAFYNQKPTLFLGAQDQVYQALLKNKEIVDKLKRSLAEPGKAQNFNDRFEQLVAPRLPKIDQTIKVSKAEDKEARKALFDLEKFVTDHTEITRRQYKNLFKDIDKGTPLTGAEAEFKKLFLAADTAYKNIGNSARLSSAEQVEANKKAIASIKIEDKNDRIVQSFKQQKDELQRQARELLTSIPKTRDLLPTQGVSPTLLKGHEAALNAYQRTLNSTQVKVQDVQIVIERLGSGAGPIGLDEGPRRLLKALTDVTNAEKAIEAQAGKTAQAITDASARELKAKSDLAKVLAEEEAANNRVAKAKTTARSLLGVQKSFTPEAVSTSPNQTEALRKQILSLNETIVKHKANVDVVKTAYANLNETNLDSLPKDVQAIRAELVKTIQAQERLAATTKASVDTQSRAYAKALADANKAADAEKRLADAKSLQAHVRTQFAVPTVPDLPGLDPSKFVRAQKAISDSTDSVIRKLQSGKVGFREYQTALEGSADPIKYDQLDSALKPIATDLQKAAQAQVQFNNAIDASIAKLQAEEKNAKALIHTQQLRNVLAIDFADKFSVVPIASQVAPKQLNDLQNSFLRLDAVLLKNLATTKDFKIALDAVRTGQVDVTSLTDAQKEIVNAISNIDVQYKRLNDTVDRHTQRSLASAKKEQDALKRTRDEAARSVLEAQKRETGKIQTEALRQSVKDIFAKTKFEAAINLSPESRTSLSRDIKAAIKDVVNEVDAAVVDIQKLGIAFRGAGDPTALEGQSNAVDRLAKLIQKAFNAQEKYNEAARQATQIKQNEAANNARIAAGQALITRTISNIGIPQETEGNRKKLEAYQKAVRDLQNQFRRSGAEASELDQILSNVGDDNAIGPLIARYRGLHEAAATLQSKVRDLNAELNKTGLGHIKDSLRDLRNSFNLAGADYSKFREILKASLSGTFVKGLSPELLKIKTDLDTVIGTVQKYGDQKKTSAQLARQAARDSILAIGQEIEAIKQRSVADEIADKNRKSRADKRLADRRAEAKETSDAETAQRRKLFPTVQAAFPTIPSFATPTDKLAVANSFTSITNAAIRAGLSVNDLEREIRDIRAQLAIPGNVQFLASLPPQMQKLVREIVATEAAFKNIETPATRAGRGILISWQGVFRIFQAQVLHTALSQIINDFRQAITEVGNFQREIALIQTITQDAANASTTFKGWSDTVVQLANELGKTPTEIATAAYDALSNQITSTREETEKFVRTAGEFARTTGSTTPDAVNLLSSAIVSYGLSASNAENVAAKFFATIDLGRVKASDLANSFGRVTSLGSALGVSLDEINAALVVLTQQGVKAPDALTQLNAVFSKLLKPTEATKDLFKELGVVSGESLIATQGFGGALATIAKAAEEGKGDFTEFFNELRSARGGFTLAKNGAEQFTKALIDLDEAEKKFESAKGFAPAAPGVQLQQQLNEIKNIITEDFGSRAAASVIQLTSSLGGLANAFRTVFNEIILHAKIVIGTFSNIKTIITTVLDTGPVGRFVLAFAGTRVVIPTAIKLLGSFQLASVAAFSGHPVLAFAAAISAGAFAVSYLTNQYKELEFTGIRSFEHQQAEAAKNLDKITDGYKKSVAEQVKIQQQGLKTQIAGFEQLATDARKALNETAQEFEIFGEQIERSLEAAFHGATDVLKQNIENTKKGIEEAKKGIEDIGEFQRARDRGFDESQFQRELTVATPQVKAQITQQRIAELIPESVKIFNEGNIKEGLDALKDINKLHDSLIDLFPKSEIARQRLIKRQVVDQAFQVQKPPKLTNDQERLNAALQKQAALMAAVATNDKQSLDLTLRRIQATEAVNRISAQDFNQNIIVSSKGAIADAAKLFEAYSALRGLGLTREQAEKQVLEQYKQQDVFLGRIKESLQALIVANEQNLAVQKANLENVEGLFKQFNAIKFFKPSGELISDAQISEAIKKINLLEGQLITALQAAGEQGAISPEVLGPKILAVQQQAEAKRASLADRIDNAKEVAKITTEQNKLKEAVEAANREIERQGRLLSANADAVARSATTAANTVKFAADQGQSLFDPGIRAFDPFANNTRIFGSSLRGMKKALDDFRKSEAEFRGIDSFDIKEPKGAENAILILDRYKKAIDTIVSLTGRSDLLNNRNIQIPLENGTTALVTFGETLDFVRNHFINVKNALDQGLNIQVEASKLNEFIKAPTLGALAPDGGSLRLIQGQNAQIVDTLGNVTATLSRVQEDLFRAEESFLKKIESLNLGERFSKALQIPLDIRTPGSISLPPPEPSAPLTDPEKLKQLPDITPVTPIIKSSLDEIREGANTLFDEANREAVVLNNNIKSLPQVFPNQPQTSIEGTTAGATGLRTAIATTLVGLNQIKERLPLQIIDENTTRASINRVQQEINGITLGPPVSNAELNGLIPLVRRINDDSTDIIKIPVEIDIVEALAQIELINLQVKPISLIDIQAFTNSVALIRQSIAQPFNLNTNIFPVLIEINRGATTLTSNFTAFGTSANQSVQSIANTIRNDLIPAILQARNSLQGLQLNNTNQVQNRATGGPIYRASGGMVPVMLTPGELVFSPEYTKKHYSQLVAMNRRGYANGGFVPKGTDTVPGFLPTGSFVLNRKSSEQYFDIKPQYRLFGGGITQDFGFHFDPFTTQGSGTALFSRQKQQLADLNNYAQHTFESIASSESTVSASVNTMSGQVQTAFNTVKNNLNELVANLNTVKTINKQAAALRPQFAAKGGMIGTDTVPGYVPSGSFVMSVGSKGMQYLRTGGMTYDSSFTPRFASSPFRSSTSNISSDNSLTMGNINVSLNGGANLSTESQALQLGKALQRQIRIGRLKGK